MLNSTSQSYWSPFVSRIAHKQLTSFGGHSQQQRFYVSQPQRKDPRCLPFLACSSILPLWLSSKYFRKHGSLDYSCRPQSLHSQFWRASVRHALKALWLHHKYSSKLPNLNFANIKIQPFFAISPNLMPAKFSRYTVWCYLISCRTSSLPYYGMWPYPVVRIWSAHDSMPACFLVMQSAVV